MRITIPSESLSDIQLQNLRDALLSAQADYPTHQLACAIDQCSAELRERARAIGTREALLILAQ